MSITEELRKLIGPRPKDLGFKALMRLHQGWWRAFVLAERPGPHPIHNEETICNTITNGQETKKNFLTEEIAGVVHETLEHRQEKSRGIIEKNRLYGNLLSSQPLAFNFFGVFKHDAALALNVLKGFYPEITEVKEVLFEYAPPEKYTGDNSAFDVAFRVMAGSQTGLIGLECKFTDSFSPKVYDNQSYRAIFQKSGNEIFPRPYSEYISSKFNQLFRNQLIAEALLQNNEFGFVHTGLFCHPEDQDALKTASGFQEMLNPNERKFRIVTYRNFIERMQQQNLSWDQRELSMLLWARYCGTQLSKNIIQLDDSTVDRVLN
jgi:hypothetical protein